MAKTKQLNYRGFTIVELLVVIVVIGILATITIVSYTGITQRATAASLQSDLTSASQQLKMYQVDHGVYPNSIGGDGCPTPADTKYCLKSSSNNAYNNYSSNGLIFSIAETNTSGTSYTVTDNSVPKAATLDPTNWQTIGTQTWAKANLNVGTMVTGVTAQTNNSILEKYCYNNTESNCTTYGGLYQWDEAMQYVTTNGAQGICSAGSHIPTDSEWATLETYLGSATEGTQLKTSGSSGLNMPLAGFRYSDGSFGNLSSVGYLWSSLESSTSAWDRHLYSGYAIVDRTAYNKAYGFSVRCLGN